jgi:hypothetical protein
MYADLTRLMLAILLLAAEKHKATFIAPIGIGLALFVRSKPILPFDQRLMTLRLLNYSVYTTLVVH